MAGHLDPSWPPKTEPFKASPSHTVPLPPINLPTPGQYTITNSVEIKPDPRLRQTHSRSAAELTEMLSFADYCIDNIKLMVEDFEGNASDILARLNQYRSTLVKELGEQTYKETRSARS